ncbi:hypothetical protein M0R45_009360 [Rubus argutus]|uniref:MHC class I antigen n=1 Tax=Rubus argutus TaxID=59490 RepID=A0AAW1Y3T4_RUBAR
MRRRRWQQRRGLGSRAGGEERCDRARARVGLVDEIANLSAPTSGLLTTVEKRCGDADAGRGEVGRRRERELVRRWRTEHGLGSKTRSEDSGQIGYCGDY